MVHPLTGERGLFIGGGRPSYSVKGDASHYTPVATVRSGSPLGIRNLIFDRLQPPPDGGRGAWPGGPLSC